MSEDQDQIQSSQNNLGFKLAFPGMKGYLITPSFS